MLEFKPISIADKVWVDELLAYTDSRATEYCFTSLFIWDKVYNTRICRYKDFLVTRSMSGDDTFYIFPAGKGDLREVLSAIAEDASSMGKSLSIGAMNQENMETLKSLFPDQFDFRSERNSQDYIYLTESLISLSGRKYQAKRNHISHFRKLSDWKYETIDYQEPERCLSLIEECSKMNDIWCMKNGCTKNTSMNNEKCAVRKAMANFIPLRLKGGLLRVDGEVVAFTIGEGLNSDTFIVHVEKAFYEVDGAYPMINREFLVHEASNYKYVNREDDAGDEGLRTAKLSYHPIFMQEKYYAIKK